MYVMKFPSWAGGRHQHHLQPRMYTPGGRWHLIMAITTTEGYWTMWRLKSPGPWAFYYLYKFKICNRHYINEVCSCAPAWKEIAGPDSSWSRMTGWKAKSGCPWDSNCSKSTLWRHGKILPIGGGVNPGIDNFSSKGDWKESEEVS